MSSTNAIHLIFLSAVIQKDSNFSPSLQTLAYFVLFFLNSYPVGVKWHLMIALIFFFLWLVNWASFRVIFGHLDMLTEHSWQSIKLFCLIELLKIILLLDVIAYLVFRYQYSFLPLLLFYRASLCTPAYPGICPLGIPAYSGICTVGQSGLKLRDLPAECTTTSLQILFPPVSCPSFHYYLWIFSLLFKTESCYVALLI